MQHDITWVNFLICVLRVIHWVRYWSNATTQSLTNLKFNKLSMLHFGGLWRSSVCFCTWIHVYLPVFVYVCLSGAVWCFTVSLWVTNSDHRCLYTHKHTHTLMETVSRHETFIHIHNLTPKHTSSLTERGDVGPALWTWC